MQNNLKTQPDDTAASPFQLMRMLFGFAAFRAIDFAEELSIPELVKVNAKTQKICTLALLVQNPGMKSNFLRKTSK